MCLPSPPPPPRRPLALSTLISCPSTVDPLSSAMQLSASLGSLMVTKAYPLSVMWTSSTRPCLPKASSSTSRGQLRLTPYTNSLEDFSSEAPSMVFVGWRRGESYGRGGGGPVGARGGRRVRGRCPGAGEPEAESGSNAEEASASGGTRE